MARFSRYFKVLVVAAAVGSLGACETLESINPFGGSSKRKEEAAKKFDDRPIYKKTGELPPDNDNARYSEEDLKASP